MAIHPKSNDPIRIVLADDHRIFLEGLERLLKSEFEIAGTAESGEELVQVALATKPDVIVTDYSMPGQSGIDAVETIRESGLDPRVVVLTMHQDGEYATEAISRGFEGYVLKQAASTELVAAIHEAFRGGRWLSPALAIEMLEGDSKRHAKLPRPGGAGAPQRTATASDDDPFAGISERQREVLQRLIRGKIAKEIAAELHISRKTVEYHKYRMMAELGVATSTELLRLAVRHGLDE